jgi:Leucine-rich repeat (LRR) protein
MRGHVVTLAGPGGLAALCSCLLLGSPGPARADIPASERAALIALYNSTNGAGWTYRYNWRNADDTDFNSPGTECTWAGVYCEPIHNSHVWELSLRDNQLTGVLPPEIASLTTLYDGLYLSGNQLTGTIPAEMGGMTGVWDLDLSNNQLSGSIPPGLGSAVSRELDLSHNQLTGPIPPGVDALSVYLDDNQLSGAIPPDIAAGWVLSLGHNQLTGPIPPQLFGLTWLDELSLDHNQLSGSIPAEIGNWDYFSDAWGASRVFRLDHNQLTGPIPREIGRMKMADAWGSGSLHLDHNQLSGSIPPEIGDIGNVGQLFLNDNELTGPIPSSVSGIRRLVEVDLSANRLSGSIPAQIGYLTVLKHLRLSRNQLTGPLPSAIANLPGLLELDLGDNRLSGSISSWLGTLGALSTLRLQGNLLSGEIPAALANLTKLTDGSSDLRWNALHTDDAALRAFLDSKQEGGDWEGTQTVAAIGLAARPPGPDSVPLQWTPILYMGDTGGYRSWYGTNPGGPYNLAGMTGDKATAAFGVGGLSPGTTYYFALDTVTEPHANNQNTVVSERTGEVTATTAAGGVGWHGLTVVRQGPGAVSSSPGGIACGGACFATFAPGTPVTLTAVLDAGSTFLGWGGACTGTALTCDLTMDSVQSVTASFGTPGLSYYTVTPCRVYDSRDPGLGGPTPPAAGTYMVVVLAGHCGISATATAVSVNVTVVSPTAGGHLRLYPSGTPRPTTSSVNYAASQTRANNAVVSLGADGSLTVYVNQPSGTTHLVIDVNGYFE